MILALILGAVPIMIVLALLGFLLMAMGAAAGIALAAGALMVAPFLIVRIIEWVSRKKGKSIHIPLLPVLLFVMAAEILYICVWLFMPVDIDLPDRERIAAAEVQYIKLYGMPEEEVEDHGAVEQGALLDALLDELYGKTYKRDPRGLLAGSRRNLIGHVVTLRDADGKELKKLHLSTDMKGIGTLTAEGIENICRLKRKTEFDYGVLADIFRVGDRADTEAIWGDFIQGLFNSFVYDDASGDLSFTIPSEKPEGKYFLNLNAHGMAAYDGTEKYEPIDLHAFEDLQKSQAWVPGETYTLNLGQSVFEQNTMRLTIGQHVFMQDLLELVDERYTYKK